MTSEHRDVLPPRLCKLPGLTPGTLVLSLLLLNFLPGSASTAEDWPAWRGAARDGVWNETGLLDTFPDDGLRVVWRVPVRAGYAGPAVAAGRVFVTDFTRGEGTSGTERALALDEATGNVLWTHSWPADYRGLEARYATGPRATPTVDGERVFVLGAKGDFFAADTATGEVLWEKDFVADYGTGVPVWGMSGAPLVDGEHVIVLVGGASTGEDGKTGGEVMAFDKATGREVWRALDSGEDPGYGAPILVEAAGTRQLIIWDPRGVHALDPRNGALYWSVPFETALGLTVATPVFDGRRLLVTSFFNGSLMLDLEPEGGDGPRAKELWRGKSSSEIETDGLHALIATPVLSDDGTIYGVCSYGETRALDAATGKRLWESFEAVVEKSRWASAFMVRQGERVWINNDRGELILARFDRKGFHEIDRTDLIEPTSPSARRRERGGVHWSHPAYANGHLVVRNDKEILRVDLRASVTKDQAFKSPRSRRGSAPSGRSHGRQP